MPVIASVFNDTLFNTPAPEFGNSVAMVGDVNGDGFGDFVVGAEYLNYTTGASGGTYTNFSVGGAALLFGSETGLLPTVDLINLLPSQGFLLRGSNAYDYVGESVSGLGDVNGDGFADVILSTEDTSGYSTQGAFILFGSNTLVAPPSGVLVLDAADPGVSAIDNGGLFEGFGETVFGVGDFNGDGFPDVGLTAYYAPSVVNTYTNTYSSYTIIVPGPGSVVLVAGDASGFASNVDISAPGADTLTLTNPGQLRYYGDPVIGYSASFQSTYNPLGFGRSVASGGDLNNDMLSDVIVGAPYFDRTGTYTSSGTTYFTYFYYTVETDVGAAYIFFGTDANIDTIDTTELNGTNGFTFFGSEAFDNAGGSVDIVGDFNGDGIDDAIIGARYATTSEIRYSVYTMTTYPGGYSFVGYGNGSYGVIYSPGSYVYVLPNFTYFGAYSYGAGGYSYTVTPPFTSYFYSMGGAYVRNTGTQSYTNTYTVTKTSAGQAYVIFGQDGAVAPAEMTRADLNSALGFIVQNDVDGDFQALGSTVAGLGDVNGDGYADIAVKDFRYSPGTTPAYAETARVSILFGSGTPPTDTVNVDTLSGPDGYRIVFDVGNGFSSASFLEIDGADINGDGFNDIILSRTRGFNSYYNSYNLNYNYVSYSTAAHVFFGGTQERFAYIDAIDGVEDGTIYTTYFGAYSFIGDIYSDYELGTDQPDFIVGLKGDDTLIGLGGDDSIFGDQGQDSIEGGLGDDELDGGTNFDIVSFENSATGVTANLAAGLAFGEGADTI
ncbi:FG-GAP repeat protein, partial [Cognatishimia sp. F0-27]|nr:FG-GAP repeat protein [Cognatishimia sp. F0-27]